MAKELTLKDYMKEDAFLFDTISKGICKEEKTDYENVLDQCQQFEESVVLFNILPSYYVMRTILCFKLEDYKTAHKYINGSLKYLIHVAKSAERLSVEEQKNFEEYKANVIDQYKILTQKRPEYLELKSAVVPESVKFITSSDESFLEDEQNRRILKRKSNSE